jgi:hypothetical protein
LAESELSLAGIIASCEDPEFKAASEDKLSKDERIQKVLNLKMAGIPVTAIAKSLGVSVGTVYSDLKHHYNEYRQRLDQEPAVNIISESLAFLDSVEETCLFEANQSDSLGEKKEFDPKTGEVKPVKRVTNTKGKLAWMQCAMKVRDMKLNLMLETGIIPREPDKIYHALKDDLVVEEDKSLDRTEDEIKKQIVELIKKSRRL